MTVENINVNQALENAKRALASEKNISASFRATMELLITLITILVNRLNLDSTNSSKPPSTDKKKIKKKGKKSEKKPGGQNGHKGTRLEPVKNPDEIRPLKINRRTLPPGKYKEGQPERRQVIDIQISRHVIEYQAQVLVDKTGHRFVAEFPEGVSQTAQYGSGIRAQVVYDSQYQLIPYNRITDDLADNAGISLSTGSVYNFIQDAYARLEEFEKIAKQKLISSDVVHADETGINVNGKKIWLHSCSNEHWSLFAPHEKRGTEAMDAIGILPDFRGILCHDHWKPYFTYNCEHSLCNAHHLRELERAYEQDGCLWASEMKNHLEVINKKKIESGNNISHYFKRKFLQEYHDILDRGEVECPEPKRKKGQRGKIKKSKARNLLERLRNFETETLRFMHYPEVPFTNNQGERDIRMTKVQQKISGCFRSFEGAKMFSRIRSFISTCKKQGESPAKALKNLFQGELPAFLKYEKLADGAE